MIALASSSSVFSNLQLVTNHLSLPPCAIICINFLKFSLKNKYVYFEGEFGIIIISGIAIPQLWRESNSKTKENKNQALKFVLVTSTFGEGNGTPLQYSCLENPMDRGAWWAGVYGVAQSRTRLKWPSSSVNIHFSVHCILARTDSGEDDRTCWGFDHCTRVQVGQGTGPEPQA